MTDHPTIQRYDGRGYPEDDGAYVRHDDHVAVLARAIPERVVTDEQIERFVSALKSSREAYVRRSEQWVDEANRLVPAVVIDGEWTIEQVRAALEAAMKAGGE